MMLKTIGTNPLSRMLLIDCWRSIVFLIIWDLVRKGTGYEVESIFIKLYGDLN
jgi:hypothetical protein